LDRLADLDEADADSVVDQAIVQVASGEVIADRLDGTGDVREPSLALPAQRGTASAMISSRNRSRSEDGVPTSTLTPSASSRSTPMERISIGRASGSSSTRKSTSLPGRSSPRATEPKMATDRPWWRAT